MALFVVSRRERGWTVMEVRGVLDTETAPELRACAATAAERTGRPLRVVADLTELSYCDVDGLSTLMAVRTMSRTGQGELRLVCPEGRVLRVLRISRLADALPVYPTLEAALAPPGSVRADRPGGVVQ
ncbi:STAS domain-containing protein [Streptomyces sp. NPDC002845]